MEKFKVYPQCGFWQPPEDYPHGIEIVFFMECPVEWNKDKMSFKDFLEDTVTMFDVEYDVIAIESWCKITISKGTQIGVALRQSKKGD